jgi:hypothetical protein
MLTAATPRSIDLAEIDPAAIVIEVPVVDEYSATAALLRQTKHGHAIANGFSGYAPPHQAIFENALRNGDASILTAFQQFGPVVILVPKDRPTDGVKQLLTALPEAQSISRNGELYELPRRVGPTPTLGRVLPIESVRTNDSIVDEQALHDGNVLTRWKAPANAGSNSQLVVKLAEEASLDCVQLGLGAYRMHYPRALRIQVASDPGPPRTVWEGRTAGMAMLAVLVDYRNPVLSISLPSGTIARNVVLTLTEQDPVFSWSVAEVRVTGTPFH